ncbi:hypothetical protein IA539_19685 [Gordonia sp. zg691]|uniref:DUF6779 domain-containing protein n=1 Tax=Gordonia jinghuaiqii TaxID=2758710 RepID=UPI0016627E2F|nr:DUF6779 domain-containing protein [Gordonia jinghuaiqii]MBD0863399.1 hypothetical protein [Gordonia jinghuaiqii]
MTTSNGRSADSRRSSRSAAQWLLGLLIVLALVASILMVFTDRLSITGSLAVIAALWAAVIGAILVTKFRRQAESAEAKSRDLRLVYELQLEREIAARRQYELDVETTIRKEVTAESNEELSELKAQVLALRSSLEMLLGEPLPDQRAALSSEKMRELASGLDDDPRAGGRTRKRPFGGEFGGVPPYGSAYADDGVLAARDFAATAPTADDGRHTGQVDPNEMTEVIPVITDDDPLSGRIATEVPEEEIERPSTSAPRFPTFGRSATERDSDTATGADDVSDAEVVDTEGADTQGADTEVAAGTTPGAAGAGDAPGTYSGESSSLPFSGGFYPGTDTDTEPGGSSRPGSIPVGEPLYTDDTPTDEWATGDAAPAGPDTAGHNAADADGPEATRIKDVRPEVEIPDAETTDAETTDAELAETEVSERGIAAADSVGDSDVQPPAFLGTVGRHEGTPGGRTADHFGGGGRRRRAADDDAEPAHSAGLPVSELLSQLRQQTESSGGGRRRRNG